MEIGRKLIYEKATGAIVFDTGEKEGFVKETTVEEDYPGFDPSLYDYLELQFGERRNEIANAGSLELNIITKELIIYPRLTIQSDKVELQELDTAIITVNIGTLEEIPVNFIVNESTPYIVNAINGQAIFQFSSEVLGSYTIKANTEKYGSNSVNLKVV